MIVVVGTVSARSDGASYGARGYAATIAFALASAGEPVEIVSKVGVDTAGEALITQFATAGIGHVALIRDGARGTPVDGSTLLEMDAADVQLALRYLTSFDAVLLVDPVDDSVVASVLDACTYVGARLVVTRLEGSSAPGVLSGQLGETAPPLEVVRPAGDPDAVTDLLVALLTSDHESPAAH